MTAIEAYNIQATCFGCVHLKNIGYDFHFCNIDKKTRYYPGDYSRCDKYLSRKRHRCKDCSKYDYYAEHNIAYCIRYGQSIRDLRKKMDVEKCGYFTSCKFCIHHCKRRFEKDGLKPKDMHWCKKLEKTLVGFNDTCLNFKEIEND